MSTTSIRRGATGTKLRNRAVAVIVALGLAIAGTTFAAPAAAVDYPSWDDVSAARNNEAATAAAVTRIQSLIAGLTAEVTRTQADAEVKGNIWQEADNKFQAASSKAATLQAQADVANAKAQDSEKRAGQMAAQLMRSGGGDTTVNLLMNAGSADDLLNTLGMSKKVSEQSYAIYERALMDKNTAQALTDQADVAKAELEVLRAAANAAFVEAQSAAVAASAALDAQVAYGAQLEAQLVVLRENRAATEADYLAGVKARFSADASLEGGMISDSGWAKPAGGYITSVYGWSAQYGSNFHKGTDLGAGCGANIYAASSGTVSYAAEGWNGGYGNYIIIDHGNGVQTAYGHIVGGGILVSPGQSVGVGQNIARVGTTGNSTGCHLHFEVRLSGATTDPVPFMSGQGITLG